MGSGPVLRPATTSPTAPASQRATAPAPARLGSARLGSARPGSAPLGPARPGSVRLGPARPGSVRLGPARPGSARLGSARLCSTRLGSSRFAITAVAIQLSCATPRPAYPLRPASQPAWRGALLRLRAPRQRGAAHLVATLAVRSGRPGRFWPRPAQMLSSPR